MEKRRIYFKEWRQYRNLTQRQVVDRLAEFDDEKLPTTEASLSRLENRKQQYSERVLEALADIYQTEPQWLLHRNPLMAGEVIYVEFDGLTQEQQESIARLIASFKGA